MVLPSQGARAVRVHLVSLAHGVRAGQVTIYGVDWAATASAVIPHQVHYSAHPALEAAWTILNAAPRGKATSRLPDELWEDVNCSPPSSDVGRVFSGSELVPRVATILPRPADPPCDGVSCVQLVYYPPGGGIGWHTNSNVPGWRAYLVRAPGASFFKTADGVYPDRNGWANLFLVEPGSWHCVGARDERWALGLRVSKDIVRALCAAA